jgi:peptidoglycan/xylan/chitin deacetylase (PgdA/CDA1 family)
MKVTRAWKIVFLILFLIVMPGMSGCQPRTDATAPSPTAIQSPTTGPTMTTKPTERSQIANPPSSTMAAPLVVPKGTTVVTIGFDDASANTYVVRPILAAHEMHATFFVIAGRVGKDKDTLTWSKIKNLYADGNEIGGHTLDHVDLTTLSVEDMRHQVCEERARLIEHGFQPTSFAYPFGSYNADAEQVVRDCGYNSGRAVSDGPETIPPEDSYALRAFSSVQRTTTLEDLEKLITDTEAAGGGWVLVQFHNICDDNCDQYSTTEAYFTAFLDWLQPRQANGTIVRTVHEVIGGVVNPPVAN